VYNLPIIHLEVKKMDVKLKKVVTIIVLIFLAIIALKIVGFVLNIIFPLAVIGGIGYIIFRLINRNSAKKY
jgi:Flp pilus assembly protein TadB